MFTRLRDGTVIPVMCQVMFAIYDSPDSIYNYFERLVIKYTWDETYDEAWEQEEPEFEEYHVIEPEPDKDTGSPNVTQADFARKASSGSA